MFPVFVSCEESQLGRENSSVFGKASSGVFEKGKDRSDQCAVQNLDWDEWWIFSVISTLVDAGTAKEQATSFRFLCHVKSNRGWKSRMFLKLHEPLFS
jgi:hypothetical protein